MLLTRSHNSLFVLILFIIHLRPTTSDSTLLKSPDDDDKHCREDKMHPHMSEHSIRRRSISAEVSSEYWLDGGRRFVVSKDAEANLLQRGKAKNIIFFLGDGMSLTTLAATRVYLGGEDKSLAFESFPYVGLAKTYAIDRLVPDSACAATAMLCGVKAKYGTVGVSGHVRRGDCVGSKNASLYVDSIAKWALESGRDVGLVTTTPVTDASPAGLYAHAADRDWENDRKVKAACGESSGVMDIALQLMQGDVGQRFKVILGGGKAQFVDSDHYEAGARRDGRNLLEEFKAASPNNAYVESREDLFNVDFNKTKRLLGLFSDVNMEYHLKALESKENKQPTLKEMTLKAIELLQTNNNGYFLFVESGHIDTAHHENKAKLALDETAQLHEAVALAKTLTNDNETLLIVTADHSHTMSVSGYAKRSNDIFGAGSIGDDNVPYLTLSYANGPSYKSFYDTKRNQRSDPSNHISKLDSDADAQFPSTVPMESATHAGEDVAVFASGPGSDLFNGVFEQSTLMHLMAFAGCLGPSNRLCRA